MNKPALFAFMILTCFLAACSKSTENNESLVGKWKKSQFLASPGPIGEWQPYTGEEFYIEFHADGNLQASSPLGWDDHTRYKIVNDSTISLYNHDSSDSVRYSYKIISGIFELRLHCIEPCGLRFERVD